MCIVDDGRVVSMQMYLNEAVRVLTPGGHFYTRGSRASKVPAAPHSRRHGRAELLVCRR